MAVPLDSLNYIVLTLWRRDIYTGSKVWALENAQNVRKNILHLFNTELVMMVWIFFTSRKLVPFKSNSD